jgi:hypothetical protein
MLALVKTAGYVCGMIPVLPGKTTKSRCTGSDPKKFIRKQKFNFLQAIFLKSGGS